MKGGKPNALAVIGNYNFCGLQTNRRTWQHYDRPGPEGKVGENWDFIKA